MMEVEGAKRTMVEAEVVFPWKYLFIVASCASGLSLLISLWSLGGHLTHFQQPRYQLHICRILLLVPLNTVVAWVSLLFGSFSPLLTTIRDCYEGFVIYTFFSLLVEYLGGEDALLDWLEVHGHVKHAWPLEYRCRSIKLGRKFLRGVKQGTLQFVFVKPCTAVIALILTQYGKYSEGSMSLSNGYVYISGINNLSISISMYSLFMFYIATEEKLERFRPVPKFVAIKSVVFLLYWQNCALNIALTTGVQASVLRQIQDTLVCCEMVVAAVAHHYAFHYDQSEDGIAPGAPENTEDTSPLIPKVAKVLNVGEEILGESRKVFLEKADEPKELEFKQVDKS